MTNYTTTKVNNHLKRFLLKSIETETKIEDGKKVFLVLSYRDNLNAFEVDSSETLAETLNNSDLIQFKEITTSIKKAIYSNTGLTGTGISHKKILNKDYYIGSDFEIDDGVLWDSIYAEVKLDHQNNGEDKKYNIATLVLGGSDYNSAGSFIIAQSRLKTAIDIPLKDASTESKTFKILIQL